MKPCRRCRDEQPRLARRVRSGGDRGVSQTLQRMRQLTHRAAVQPAVVLLARRIILPAGRRDRAGQIRLVREWLSDHTKWMPDPERTEYLVPPAVLLGELQRGAPRAGGDCDDVAMLGAALGKAVGIPARFTAVAFEPMGAYRHVFAELWDGQTWRELDTTRPSYSTRVIERALTLGV